MKAACSQLFCLLLLGSLNCLAQSSKPNFIFIVFDDLNDYVGYLEERNTTSTPALDQLSARGVSFVNAYANSPLCAPSRTSFLTGKSPDYIGLIENDDYTDRLTAGGGKFRGIFDDPSAILTFPEYLKDSAGYYTCGLGKVFNGWYSYTNNDNDFDSLTLDPCERGLSWNAFADYPTSETAVPVDSPAPYYQGVTSFRFSTMPDSLESEMEDTKMMNAAMDFIDNYVDDPGDFCDKPFFLALGIHKPHAPRYIPERYFPDFYRPDMDVVPYAVPYNVPENAWPPNGDSPIPKGSPEHSDFENLGDFAKQFAIGVGGDAIFDTFPYLVGDAPVISPGLDTATRFDIISDSKRALATLAYEASVAYADQQINRLLNKLEEYPLLYSNTVIVVVSDHGHSSGQKKHWRKGCLWNTDLHVPLIIADPRQSTGGSLNYSPVSLLDLFPTFTEMAGLPTPLNADGTDYPAGESLVELVEDPSITWNRTVASLVGLPQGTPYCRQPNFSIQDKDYHYIRYEYGIEPMCDSLNVEEELYHIGAKRNLDRYELNNLVNDPAYQNIKNYLSTHVPSDSLNLAYSRPLPSLKIIPDTLPCSWNSTDTFHASVQWLNPKGIPVSSAPSSIFTIDWYINGMHLATGDTMVSFLPEWDSLDRSVIELTLSDNIGRVFALDRLELIAPTNAPTASFSCLIDANQVTLEEVSEMPFGFVRDWDWGDGTVLSETQPAPHIYTNPGTYTITTNIQSAQEGYDQCSWSADTTITLDSNSFPIGSCQTPLPPTVLAASADRFKLKWSPVYQATKYTLRFKKKGRKFANYKFGATPFTETIAGPLVPGKQWIVEINAVCGTDTSDWSWPTTFANTTCIQPGRPSLTYLTADTVSFEWTASQDAILGYDILLRDAAANNRIFSSPPNQLNFSIGALDDGTAYRLFLRSRCIQVDSGTYEPSRHVSTSFATPLLSLLPAPAPFLIIPNPASSDVYIQGLPLSNDERLLEIIDLNGKQVLSIQLNSDQHQLHISLGSLVRGQYMIRVLTKGAILATAPLTIQ